jgi:inorganic pyrophosphatase
MHDLTRLAHELDRDTRCCRAIIETPKGCRSKFDYDRETRCFLLKSVLPEGMSFPLDFGFIPSTLGGDGDPLDVMVMADEPSPVGALLQVRLVGVIEAEEHEHGRAERNDRLLAVASKTQAYAEIATPDDLPDAFVQHLTDFWINKDRLEGKEFKSLGVRDPATAVELVRRAVKAAKRAS